MSNPGEFRRARSPGRDYVVMATSFTVTSRIHLPPVVSATQQLWRTIEVVQGLVGYSLRADPARGTLATLSAWHDSDLLTAFVRGEQHTAVASRTRRWLRRSDFASWTVAAADLPPSWDDADLQLRAR